MRSMKDRKHTGRLLGWSSAAVLVAGSIGFTGPAFAAQPDTPPAHSAQGQAQSSQGEAHSTQGQAHKQANQSKQSAATHQTQSSKGSSQGSSQGGSAVSLDKPNDFQAQADPDGMENGGVDQPGGTGGVDTFTQDGNNGSGNDTDCEDDNRGVGIPGHCKDRSPEGTPPVVDEPATQSGLPGGGLLQGSGGEVAGQVVQSGVPATSFSTLAGIDTSLVSAPSSSASQVKAQVRTRAAQAGPATGVLPNTGASAALLSLALAALAALGVGAGLVRRGRRTALVTS